MTDIKHSDETAVPEWLEKLQNESWQAELLISGGALVGLFSSYDFIAKTGNYFKYSSDIDYSTISAFQIASGLVVFILIIGFISHLLLRGFWIGLIGLNSVFPNGIDAGKLSFQGRFRNFFKEEKNNALILRLDKVCGLIFALTFVTLFSFLGVILFAQVVAILQQVFPSPSETKSTLVYLLIASIFIIGISAGVLTFIDFLTGGRLKKIEWLAPVYYPLHWIISIITFSFLYRRLYYTIVSNIKGYYLILILCIPIAIVFVLLIFDDSYSGLANSRNTNAQFESAEQTQFLSIKNEIVRENEIEISVLHLVRLESEAFEKWKRDTNSKATSFGQLSDTNKSKILRSLYRIFIDSVEIKDTDDWLISTQRDGGSFISMKWIKLVKFIDVRDFKNGNHKLSVKIDLASEKVNGYRINDHNGYHGMLNFILHTQKHREQTDTP